MISPWIVSNSDLGAIVDEVGWKTEAGPKQATEARAALISEPYDGTGAATNRCPSNSFGCTTASRISRRTESSLRREAEPAVAKKIRPA